MRTIERAARVAAIGVRAAVEAADLAPERRGPAVLYLLTTGCNLPGAIAAAALGCTKQNVSKQLGRVETLRDDPAFDAALARLEAQLFGGAV